MPQGRPQRPVLPILAVLVAIISVQAGASMAKGLFPAVGAQGATALRLAFACLMMMAIWRPWRRAVPAANRLPILAYGVALGCMNLSFYMALRTLPLGLAVAMEFIGPLTVAVVASRRLIDLLWVAMAATGIALLLALGPATAHVDPTGAGFALAAGVCWGLYIVFGKRAGADGAQGQAVAYGAVIAALIAIPFGIAQAGATLLSPAILWPALSVALLSSAVPYSLEMTALSRMPARTFGILMSLEPAFGALSGFLILGERLNLLQILAVALIMTASAGVVLVQGGETAPAA